jgi:hypothetical protein
VTSQHMNELAGKAIPWLLGLILTLVSSNIGFGIYWAARIDDQIGGLRSQVSTVADGVTVATTMVDQHERRITRLENQSDGRPGPIGYTTAIFGGRR